MTTAPIVAEDGSAYLQVVQTTRVEHGYCSQADISRADDHVVQLIRVTPAGELTAEDLYRFVGPHSPWWPETGQVLPDGLGGVVATWSRRQTSPLARVWGVTRFDAAGIPCEGCSCAVQ